MNYLLDNDVLFKMAAYDLLEEFAVSLSHSESPVFYVLSSAAFQLHINENFRSWHYDAMKKRVSAFIKVHNDAENPSFCDDVAPLVHHRKKGLDIGELILLSACSLV